MTAYTTDKSIGGEKSSEQVLFEVNKSLIQRLRERTKMLGRSQAFRVLSKSVPRQTTRQGVKPRLLVSSSPVREVEVQKISTKKPPKQPQSRFVRAQRQLVPAAEKMRPSNEKPVIKTISAAARSGIRPAMKERAMKKELPELLAYMRDDQPGKFDLDPESGKQSPIGSDNSFGRHARAASDIAQSMSNFGNYGKIDPFYTTGFCSSRQMDGSLDAHLQTFGKAKTRADEYVSSRASRFGSSRSPEREKWDNFQDRLRQIRQRSKSRRSLSVMSSIQEP